MQSNDMSKSVLRTFLSLPCAPEFVGVARLAISGIASRMNFPIEQIEDIKIAVSEICTNVVQHAYEGKRNPFKDTIDIEINSYPDKLEILIKDKGLGFDLKTLGSAEQKKKSEEKMGLGLGLTFVQTLMDDSEFISKPGQGTTIKIIKNTPTPFSLS